MTLEEIDISLFISSSIRKKQLVPIELDNLKVTVCFENLQGSSAALLPS